MSEASTGLSSRRLRSASGCRFQPECHSGLPSDRPNYCLHKSTSTKVTPAGATGMSGAFFDRSWVALFSFTPCPQERSVHYVHADYYSAAEISPAIASPTSRVLAFPPRSGVWTSGLASTRSSALSTASAALDSPRCCNIIAPNRFARWGWRFLSPRCRELNHALARTWKGVVVLD
jgi:hypothetical protein